MDLFIKRTRYAFFTSTTLKQIGYEKRNQEWLLKGGRQWRAATAPTSSPQDQSEGSASQAPSWFTPFYNEFTSFSRDMREGLKILQDNYSSLDHRFTRMEQIRGSSSHGDPIDTSSIPHSDDSSTEESKEEKEGDDEEEEEAGNEEGEDEDEEEEEADDEASDGAKRDDD
ncbi:uncharacterized protein LOC131148003 [Malania oleifera]|uniref:uncharacterized protein LOC131148003 n=1 Tax=Malania oleifera TaxID=397392 RepID=UPI0025ADA3B8|nr:uncharacterized protein LOC131148003 [Malania oleifera]